MPAVLAMTLAACATAAERDAGHDAGQHNRAETSPLAMAIMACMADVQRRADASAAGQPGFAGTFDKQIGIVVENSDMTPEQMDESFAAGTDAAAKSRSLVDCIHFVLSDDP